MFALYYSSSLKFLSALTFGSRRCYLKWFSNMLRDSFQFDHPYEDHAWLVKKFIWRTFVPCHWSLARRFLISLYRQDEPMMLMLQEVLDFSYWPRGRSLATLVAGYISVCPRDMSIGWVCPLWEACFLPNEVCDLSCEVCCLTRLSCNFASYFSLWKSLRVSCTTLLSHITPLGTLALLCFALVCYLEYTLLSTSNS